MSTTDQKLVRIKEEDGPMKVFARDGACDRHGDFESKMLSWTFPDGTVRDHSWSRCPSCADEQAERHSKWLREQAEQRQLEARINRSGIPLRFHDAALGNYVASTRQQRRALEMATEYASDFRETWNCGRSLLLLGNVGNGKTHLAVGIAFSAMEQRFQAAFTTAADMINRVKATWGPRQCADSETQEQVIRHFASVQLLVIDDLGSIKCAGREVEILFSILGSRYNDMLPTVFTANLAPAELPDYLGIQVVSRLRESGARTVIFDWDDYRPIKGRRATSEALEGRAKS